MNNLCEYSIEFSCEVSESQIDSMYEVVKLEMVDSAITEEEIKSWIRILTTNNLLKVYDAGLKDLFDSGVLTKEEYETSSYKLSDS